MDEEPPIFIMMKDQNRLLEEIEDDDTFIKPEKGLITLHEKLEESEEELRLTNYKVNKPELEVLAKQLIELREQIAERAKRQEEL